MKKAGINGLVTISLILTALMIGLFIGRRLGPLPIAAGTEESTASIVDTEGRLNVNTATAEQLQFVPGIGPVLAQRIVAYREENGPFSNIFALSSVEGIGLKKLEALTEYLTAGG